MSTLRAVQKSMNPFTGPTSTRISPSGYRGGKEFWFFNADGRGHDVLFSYSGYQSSLKAFECCSPLFAIIIKKAQAYLNGKTWILNRTGKGKGKEATSEVASNLRKLLKRPNPVQSWKEFEAQNYIFQQLFGFCPVLPIKAVGFPNIEATALWNIPPSILEITESEKLFYNDADNLIKKIVVKYGNETGEISPKDVYFFKDFVPSFSSVVLPQSRIKSLEMAISNIIGAYESRGHLIDYRGAMGVLSPDAKDAGGPVPLKQDDKEELQQDFLRYGLKYNQWKFIISNASVKWSQIGIPTKDLMLFEEIDDDIMRICDNYNYPYRLMSSEKSNSLGGSDVKEFKKQLYQDGVIPEGESIYEQWNEFFKTDEYNLNINKDFSHVAALQADEQQSATARKTRNEALLTEFYMNMLTLNQWLEKNGEDPLEDAKEEGQEKVDIGNMYYYQLVKEDIEFGKIITQTNNNQQEQQPAAKTK